ncbi:MAG: DUF4139 domain-containing protein [Bacteroidales bacterium]|nr:DUF4139 domain-containing protein [Bacteroidales bacterium]
MKTLFIILFSMGIIMNSQAQTKPVPVKSDIKKVTVFLNGAQVTRTGKVSVPKGNGQIIIEGLPQNINPNSIQVTGKGSFTILAVQHQINYLNSQKKTKEIIMLEDSLKLLRKNYDKENTMLGVYAEEESMLISNKKIGGNDAGLRTEELRQATEYYRTRLTDIKLKQLAIKEKLNDLNVDITRIGNQLNLLQVAKNLPTSEIVLDFSCPALTSASLEISYLVGNAYWVPAYDLRATDVDKPVSLTYKANVFQNTGESWENVELTMSTGNPMQDQTKPNLYPWYLNFYYAYADKNKGMGGMAKSRSQAPASFDNSAVADEMYAKEEISTGADFTEVNIGQTNVEFKIDIPYTILSDAKFHAVEMQKYDLKADYRYFSAPKISADAFLTAQVTGWEEYNLMYGEMNIFFEGKYLGKSYLNPKNTNDTLDISLGRDKSIMVTRTRIKDFYSKKMIGTNQKDSRGWEIAVRNTKKKAVKILIEDQVPISTNKEIEIETIEVSGAKHDQTTGKLSWEFEIKPAETKKMITKYSVKYPKGQSVILE